uniref:hypothetical protein n=1 Tax=Enterobacteriaceae TaxID=543 RepID=UPI00155DCD5C|nr:MULTISPECIES: hypothetical protein [Enterobacteriaceae]
MGGENDSGEVGQRLLTRESKSAMSEPGGYFSRPLYGTGPFVKQEGRYDSR